MPRRTENRAINSNMYVCQLKRCIFAAQRFMSLKYGCKILETFRAKNRIGNILFDSFFLPWFGRASVTSHRIVLLSALPVSIRLDLLSWDIFRNEVKNLVACQFIDRCCPLNVFGIWCCWPQLTCKQSASEMTWLKTEQSVLFVISFYTRILYFWHTVRSLPLPLSLSLSLWLSAPKSMQNKNRKFNRSECCKNFGAKLTVSSLTLTFIRVACANIWTVLHTAHKQSNTHSHHLIHTHTHTHT